MKKRESKKANASVEKNTVRKMLNMPFCAYCVQIWTTLVESVVDALVEPVSSRMFRLMNSTARYAPVDTACVDAPENQKITAPPVMRPSRKSGFKSESWPA